jgi:hypothetical protein
VLLLKVRLSAFGSLEKSLFGGFDFVSFASGSFSLGFLKLFEAVNHKIASLTMCFGDTRQLLVLAKFRPYLFRLDADPARNGIGFSVMVDGYETTPIATRENEAAFEQSIGK